MADQLDFGVTCVKVFSVRRASVSMDTFKKKFIQHGLYPYMLLWPRFTIFGS